MILNNVAVVAVTPEEEAAIVEEVAEVDSVAVVAEEEVEAAMEAVAVVTVDVAQKVVTVTAEIEAVAVIGTEAVIEIVIIAVAVIVEVLEDGRNLALVVLRRRSDFRLGLGFAVCCFVFDYAQTTLLNFIY